MTSAPTIVFDLDGTLVDTAPDLIDALNFVLDREGLRPVPLQAARNLIGAGARKLIERGLELEGRMMGVEDVNRLTKDFIDYYAAHIAARPRHRLLQDDGVRFGDAERVGAADGGKSSAQAQLVEQPLRQPF